MIIASLCFTSYAKDITTMSNENITTIHEFDFNLICEFFLNTERQGPGSPEITLKALSFIDNLTDRFPFHQIWQIF